MPIGYFYNYLRTNSSIQNCSSFNPGFKFDNIINKNNFRGWDYRSRADNISHAPSSSGRPHNALAAGIDGTGGMKKDEGEKGSRLLVHGF